MDALSEGNSFVGRGLTVLRDMVTFAYSQSTLTAM